VYSRINKKLYVLINDNKFIVFNTNKMKNWDKDIIF
jgi:hypothetical protein